MSMMVFVVLAVALILTSKCFMVVLCMRSFDRRVPFLAFCTEALPATLAGRSSGCNPTQ
jgi:hypothetical protein